MSSLAQQSPAYYWPFRYSLESSSSRCSRRDRCEPLDELERLLGDLPPAGVDCQRVPAVRHLDDLGHALVAFLLFVGRVRDRPGNRMVRVGGDDQHRTALRVRRVDFGLRPRIEVRGRRLEERLAGAGDGVAEVQLLRLVLADRVREAVAELLVAEWDRAVPVRGVAQGDAGRAQRRDRQREYATERSRADRD